MSRLTRYLNADAPAFALLYRPGATGPGVVELVSGELVKAAVIADLPVPVPGSGRLRGRHDLLAVVPYRQIAERGFAAVADDAELLAMTISEQEIVPLGGVLAEPVDGPVEFDDLGFDVTDADYADLVRLIIDQEINRGAGSNIVLRRTYLASIRDYSPAKAFTLFRSLLLLESGAHWTFLIHLGDLTLVGASPERHISVRDGIATMNPMSGTYAHPPGGPDLEGVLDFLADRKESDELAMVLEEELKIMAEVCETGGRAIGPFLKEMGQLAHTEYFVEGRTSLDLREILRRTLVSPVVTGSPLESACQAIRRREPDGRGYYGGVVALFGTDAANRPSLDSAILIQTAQIDQDGVLSLGVGATVVQKSDPVTEAAETRVMAAGLLRSLAGEERQATGGNAKERLSDHPAVRATLERRNENLAGFWLTDADTCWPKLRSPSEHRILVVDADDVFTPMLAHQLRALGPQVTVRRFDEPFDADRYDLVVAGPGPGSPKSASDSEATPLATRLYGLLVEGRPVFAIGLGHQILCRILGLPLLPLAMPNQGTQKQIEYFGAPVRVGFYNSFAAQYDWDEIQSAGLAESVAVSRNPRSGEVYGLRGRGFLSCQFHPESVLSPDGLRVLDAGLAALLPGHVTSHQELIRL